MHDPFFSPKFSKCMRYFSPENLHNVCAIFRQFSDVKNEGCFQQPSILGQLVSGEPQRTRISHPKER